jgi:hypothetical protein
MVRGPALQCRAEITFHHQDGHNVFGRAMDGRWASSPEPVPSPISTSIAYINLIYLTSPGLHLLRVSMFTLVKTRF